MFITELATTVKRWKQSKCPQTDEWINTMQSIRIILIQKRILTHTVSRMNIKGITQSVINSHKKTNIL